ncbi:MAG: ribosome-binding factor A [Patescibacteria group bacterium]
MADVRDNRDNKMKDEVKRLASEFLLRESNFTSLITITDVRMTDRGKQALILFTVLPEDKQDEALNFLKRKRAEFRDHVMNGSRISRVPFFDFDIDTGEKNRQKIEEISMEIEKS